jgi:predicted DNA-binding transcriptional regulator AlpA
MAIQQAIASSVQDANALVREHEVAKLLQISLPTLRRWRLLKQGPRYIKLNPGDGGAVRYRLADVEAFLASKEAF